MGAGETEHGAVLRWGARRLMLISMAMVGSMFAVAICTDTFAFFSAASARNILRISSILPPTLSPSSPSELVFSVPPLTVSSPQKGAPFQPTSLSKSLPPLLAYSSERSVPSGLAPLSSSLPQSPSVPLASVSPPSPSTSSSSSLEGSSTTFGCSYTEGRWVKNERKPFYSGESCKTWLSEMWACRLMPGRPNFNYEGFRWQPDGCNLPEFSSRDFLYMMQNKVVVFVGDSIGRQQYQSLMCMLTGGDDEAPVEDAAAPYGLVKRPGAIRPDGYAQRFKETNTTIIFYWSVTLCEVQPLNVSDPNTEYALHLDRPVTFIQKYLRIMDMLILNTGHHWNRGKMELNKWMMHVDGKPNATYARDIGSARELALHKLAEWLHQKKEKNLTNAEVYMRSLSPRHFFDGEWNTGGRCDEDFMPMMQHNITGPGSDPVIESAVSGTSLRLLNITYVSQFRYDGHVSKYWRNTKGQDCLHWCLPGVPDVWNELLYADMVSQQNKQRGTS